MAMGPNSVTQPNPSLLQPNPTHQNPKISDPTQPNPWVDPTQGHVWYKHRLSRLTCARDEGKRISKEVTKAYFSRVCERPLAEKFQPNFSHLEISPTLSIVQSFMTIGDGVQILHGVEKRRFP
jgi:hypothetical protein